MQITRPTATEPINTKPPIPELLSISLASKIAGISRNTLAYFIKHNKLPVVKLPFIIE